jgi:hypothetical protein
VKILAWFSLSSITPGRAIAAGPHLLLLIFGEDSEEGAALVIDQLMVDSSAPTNPLLPTLTVACSSPPRFAGARTQPSQSEKDKIFRLTRGGSPLKLDGGSSVFQCGAHRDSQCFELE